MRPCTLIGSRSVLNDLYGNCFSAVLEGPESSKRIQGLCPHAAPCLSPCPTGTVLHGHILADHSAHDSVYVQYCSGRRKRWSVHGMSTQEGPARATAKLAQHLWHAQARAQGRTCLLISMLVQQAIPGMALQSSDCRVLPLACMALD